MRVKDPREGAINPVNWLRKTMYSTFQEYLEEFGEDDLPSGGEARVIRAIERASRKADGYILAAGLDTPVTDLSAIVDLSGPVLDIARYNAYDSPSDELRKRYEDAIRWFEGLAVGRNRMRVAEKETRKSGFHNVRLVRS